ncbi:RNA-directed DNA polymerase, eukaryota [Tanacetum coccineum]
MVEGTSLVNIKDRWIWSLQSSGDFTVASIRKLIDEFALSEVSSSTRWIKAVPIKVNVLAWKIKLDNLPTRLNISRRGMDIESILFPTCGKAVESTRHIFFTCQIARDILHLITSWWNIPYMEVSSYEECNDPDKYDTSRAEPDFRLCVNLNSVTAAGKADFLLEQRGSRLSWEPVYALVSKKQPSIGEIVPEASLQEQRAQEATNIKEDPSIDNFPTDANPSSSRKRQHDDDDEENDVEWREETPAPDGVDVEVPEDAEGVLIANIGSYMGGVDLWQNENHNNDNFDPQSMHDKRLEVVSISGTWHLGKLQVLDVTTGVLIDEYTNMMLWALFWACIVEALEGSCNDALSCVLDFHGDMACHLGKLNDCQILSQSQMSSTSLILRSTQLILDLIKGIDFLEFQRSEIASAVVIYVVGIEVQKNQISAIFELAKKVGRPKSLVEEWCSIVETPERGNDFVTERK